MNVKSTNGTNLEITVSGYKQEPLLTLVKPTEIQGRKIAGRITMGKNRQVEGEGFYCRSDVFIRANDAVQEIRAEIENLPEKVYRIYLGKEQINADGDIIEVPKWTHENGGVRGANQSDIVRMLEKESITDISVEDAAKRWNDHVADVRRPYVEAAKHKGKPVEYRRAIVECQDPREECSADLAITYMHEDGTMHTEYTHTY